MIRAHFFASLLGCFFVPVFCDPGLFSQWIDQDFVHGRWEDDPLLTPEQIELFQQFVLPADHPARIVLDQIFSETRATLDLEHFLDAGFCLTRVQGAQVVVAKHPALPGYVVKAHLDDQKEVSDIVRLGTRLVGARLVQEIIANQGLTCVKAPAMWAYPLLLAEPFPRSRRYKRKHFMIVAEDVRPLPQEENLLLWKSEAVTKHHLDELFHIITIMRFHDMNPSNVPFCEDGYLYIVDFEDYWRPVPNTTGIAASLSEGNQIYWNSLIMGGG